MVWTKQSVYIYKPLNISLSDLLGSGPRMKDIFIKNTNLRLHFCLCPRCSSSQRELSFYLELQLVTTYLKDNNNSNNIISGLW